MPPLKLYLRVCSLVGTPNSLPHSEMTRYTHIHCPASSTCLSGLLVSSGSRKIDLISVSKRVPNALEFVEHAPDIRESNRAKKRSLCRISIRLREFLHNRANEIATVSTECQIPSNVLSFIDIIVLILAHDPDQEQNESVAEHHILFP
jgi:hypothetical protein